MATYGSNVLGVDVNQRLILELRQGKVRVQEPGLHAFIVAALEAGNLRVDTSVDVSDVYIIAVPTPLEPVVSANAVPKADLSYVAAAAEAIVPHLRRGALVILESTSPPGTTTGLVRSILERRGLVAGDDFSLAFCAERVIPGRILTELVENDRIIGGVDSDSAERARDLYATFVQGEIYLTDATTAEMVKLMENTFRDVNIALANEFGRISEKVGIDVHEAIRLANRHPRVNILQPGPGVGGHCIAVDPWFIVNAAPSASTLIQAAREVNDGQPAAVVQLIEQAVEGVERPRIAVLGLAYKADIDDLRESPSLTVVHLLQLRGHLVSLHDALAVRLPDGTPLEGDLEQVLTGADVMVILTDHIAYRQLNPSDGALAAMGRKAVVDTRHCLNYAAWRSEGFTIYSLGDGLLTRSQRGFGVPTG